MVTKGKKVKENDTLIKGKTKGKVGWELAIAEAKSKLYRNLAQRRRLYAAIRLFEEKIKARVPWPGSADSSSAE
jgi:hypothetical protein